MPTRTTLGAWDVGDLMDQLDEILPPSGEAQPGQPETSAAASRPRHRPPRLVRRGDLGAVWPTSAASTCRLLPSLSRAPRTVLPSSRTGTSPAESSPACPEQQVR